MASGCKKRRFRDPQSVERSIENIRNAIPQTTRYKNRWGVRIFEDWQNGRENKAVMCESNPLSLEFAKFGDRIVFNDGKNVKLLAYQICSRSFDKDGWQARAYSIPNYMLVETTSTRKWPG